MRSTKKNFDHYIYARYYKCIYTGKLRCSDCTQTATTAKCVCFRDRRCGTKRSTPSPDTTAVPPRSHQSLIIAVAKEKTQLPGRTWIADGLMGDVGSLANIV